MNWQKLQRMVFVSFLVLIAIIFIAFYFLGYSIDSGEMREYLKSFGILAPLIFIVIYILGTVFIPATPFMIIAGILFGFKYGVIYSLIGGLVSSSIIFNLSRILGKEWVEKILEHRYFKHLNEYNKRLETGAIWDLIMLRVLPIMPFNVLNILMGVSKIKKKDYTFGTILGLIPSNVLTVYIGSFITKMF